MSVKRSKSNRAGRETSRRRGTARTRADQVPFHGPVEKLLTYDDVADVLGVTARTVYTLVKRGDLTALKVGGSSRVDPADLRAFIKRAKVGPSPIVLSEE